MLVLRLSNFVVLGMALVLSIGCASGSKSSSAEPPVIVVRNACGVDLRIVSLRGSAEYREKNPRLGSVSPVPKGASQVFVRPSSRPPLPKELEITWVDAPGRSYARSVSLESVLKEATGEPGEALVFEIRPSGAVAVYCEQPGSTM